MLIGLMLIAPLGCPVELVLATLALPLLAGSYEECLLSGSLLPLRLVNWLIKGLTTGSDSGPEVGVASLSNPLALPAVAGPAWCLLFNALRSRELNLLNAGFDEMGGAPT